MNISAFIALGAVVLAVTGAEALYADMSHFGRRPIRAAWTYFVLPCLLLNYFGQGALVIARPHHRSTTPSTSSAPHSLRIAAGRALHPGHHHRQPGGHHRRLFHGPAMHPARPVSAHGSPPHLRDRGRPDLRAPGQRHAGPRRHPAGSRLQDQRRAGLGLRHRRHRHLPVHQHPGDRRVPPPIRLVAPRRPRRVRLFRPRGPRVLRLQHAEILRMAAGFRWPSASPSSWS